MLIVPAYNLVFCDDCPEPNLIAPCTCNSISITCSGEEPIELEKIFENLKNKLNEKQKYFYELVINNTVITELTDNMFKDIKFHTIFIHGAHSLRKIHEKAFQGTKAHTKLFVLKKCKNFDSLELFDILNSFENIETISISNINLTEIPAHIFKPLKKLYSVAFIGPNFERIGEKAFEELRTIRFIDIVNTSISYIPDNIFVFKSSDIRLHIGLFYNQINGTGFSAGAFANIGRPAKIHFMGFIDDNDSDRIKFLDKNVFQPFLDANKDNKIVLKYEVLDCNDCRNQWLKNAEYANRVYLLRCSNERPFDSEENFISC